MSYVENLDAVMRDAWTRDMTGGLDVRIIESVDAGRMFLVVGDEKGHTRTRLDPPLLADAQTLVAYLDGEIEKAVRHHRQPLKHYPQVSAADEMEYLTV